MQVKLECDKIQEIISKRKDTVAAVSFFMESFKASRRKSNRLPKGGQRMDDVDRNILKYLRENARISATDLSKKVNLSVAAVAERIRKMETGGIIGQYTLLLNQHMLGNDVSALMEVSLEHPKYYEDFTRQIGRLEEVEACYYVTGDYDFMLKINTRSSVTLEKIHRTIKSIKGVSGTKTFFVLKEVKNVPAPIPGNASSKET